MHLHIDNLDCRYKISSRAAYSESVRRRFDKITTELLAKAWDGIFSSAGAADGPIFFIDELEINLSFDSSLDDLALAEVFAARLDREIVRRIAQNDPGTLVFRNHAELLARYLSDLLHGRTGWQRHYREFEGAAAGAVGQKLVGLLVENGDTGREVLIEITEQGDLDLLLATLSDAEVEIVAVRCLLQDSPDFFSPGSLGVWSDALLEFFGGTSFVPTGVIARDTTAVYLKLLGSRPDLGPDVNLARFIRELFRLRQSIMDQKVSEQFLISIVSGDWPVFLAADPRTRWVISSLLHEIGGRSAAVLLSAAGVQATETRQIFPTSFGGLFALVGSANEMGLHRLLSASPYRSPLGVSKQAMLSYLIALQCLGRRNTTEALGDKGAALFAGLKGPPELDQLREFCRDATADAHAAFKESLAALLKRRDVTDEDEFSLAVSHDWITQELDRMLSPLSSALISSFAARLGAFSTSSPEFLRRNFIESRAEIELSREFVRVKFLSCPLQMVLRMAGFDHFNPRIEWLENRVLLLEFA